MAQFIAVNFRQKKYFVHHPAYPGVSSILNRWEYCADLFKRSEELNSIAKEGKTRDNVKYNMILGGEWNCHDGTGRIIPCSEGKAEYFLHAYSSHRCRLQFWRLENGKKCVRKPFSYKNQCPEPLKPCGQLCTLPQEPCNGQCRDGWVTCFGKNETCHPDGKHCCGDQDLFYCESNKVCTDKSKKQWCPDGSCKNWNETCPSCPKGQTLCEATKLCDKPQACSFWKDFPTKVN